MDDQTIVRSDKQRSAVLTRRSILQGVSGVIGLGMFPRGMAKAAAPPSEVTTKLTEYMSNAWERALPDEVIEKVKHHILDTFAAMISGSELPPGRAAIRFAGTYGGEKVAMVVGSNIRCGPIEAALANGVIAHADETDDSWPGGWHPGCNAVPAALATGEQFGISGMHFMRAVALGYDVGARVLISLRPGVFETHKSTHSIGGVFGAAAAAGCAAKLTAQQMRWMLDYTAQQSSGIASWDRDTDHIEKGFVFGGMPARNGVTSALLVQSGWNGVEDVMSGTDNFLLANAPHNDERTLIDKLGERYEIAATSIKKWTVGSPIQAPLDALEIMLRKHSFEPDQVKEVVVRMNPGSVVDNREMPDICIQHMIAIMMIDKTVTFRSAHDRARMQDPAVLRQRAKVRLEPGAANGRGRGAGQPLVIVTLTDGTRLAEDAIAVLGTANNPMTRDQVVAKARELMTPVLGATAAGNIVDGTLGLGDVRDIRELRAVLQRA